MSSEPNQKKQEYFSEEKESETKTLKIKLENIDNNNIKNEKIKNKPFLLLINKLFIIRAMLFLIFVVFCYYFIKLIQKGSNINKKRRLIYIQNELNELNLDELKTHQLINKKNIKIIKELDINLNIEHSKYVHLKIKDRYNQRWEVPHEILNEEYFNNTNNKNNSINFKMKYSNLNEAFYFYLYYESKKENGEIENNIFYKFNTSKNFLFSKNYINIESHLTSDDIYGFGERIHNFKLKEGLYTIWPRDQANLYDDGKGGKNLYGHQPIGLHKTKYKDIWLGFVFLNTNPQDVQIYKKDNDTILSHKTIGGIIDYYIIVDNSPENVLRDIHYLIGIPILPPYWSLGNHQCRWGYNNDNEFINVYKTYKSKEISIDTMWIDIDAMIKYQIFTLNKNKFEHLPEYVENIIHKDHGYFVPIIDIGISYNKEDLNKYSKIGDKNNLFIKSGYTKKNLIGKVWPGKTVFPDFFNPFIYKLWYTGLENYYEKIKYDGIWLDMNEPSNSLRNGIYPGEMLGENEKKCNLIKDLKISYLPGYTNNFNSLITGTISMNGITYHDNTLYNNKPLINVYQEKQTYNYLKHKNKRPFILTRANSFGSGKYSFHWLGDNYSQNKYIEYSIAGIFNYNIFGIPFTGADICGFNGNSNGKLCARWYNIGAFYPFSRNHNSKKRIDQYPWSFGQDIENIINKDIKYRYSLLRYFYSQLFLISLNEKGSFFKPVMFEFQDDIYSYEDIESKIMIGEALLICVFFDNEEKDKEFILPNSHFNLYPSGENILNYYSEDNINLRRKILSGKLSELHLFLRGGYIIPMQNTFNKYIINTFYLRQEKINIIINPDNEGNSKGVIFYDNDENDVISINKYIRVDLEFKNKTLNITINVLDYSYYKYKDNILNKIEVWRINEILEDKVINNKNIVLKGKVKNNEQNLNGHIIKNKNKIIIDLDNISLFDLQEINLNTINYN